MAPSVKQRSRVRQDRDGAPPRFGRIGLMLYHWREETQQHEYTVLVHWDEDFDSWWWLADLVAVKG